MKPSDGRYQTATQVNVLSPVKLENGEVESFHLLEDSKIHFAMARNKFFSRGLSQRYGIEWILQELGRAFLLFGKITHIFGQVRDNESELILVIISPELAIRIKRLAKVSDNKLKRRGFAERIKAVGLIHSRGVTGVMSCESNWAHSKGLALICKGKEKHNPNFELAVLWKRN